MGQRGSQWIVQEPVEALWRNARPRIRGERSLNAQDQQHFGRSVLERLWKAHHFISLGLLKLLR